MNVILTAGIANAGLPRCRPKFLNGRAIPPGASERSEIGAFREAASPAH